MNREISAVRGMPTLLPAASGRRQFVEKTCQHVLRAFAYKEMRPPLIEKTSLFARTIGEATEIVEKEMYSFADRNQVSLSLRPEATAGMVRACLENGLLQEGLQRLWCLGPMFRYERPQSGRTRQFDQLDVEIIGTTAGDFTDTALDAELVWISACFWEALRLSPLPRLHINALGNQEARTAYNKALRAFFRSRQDELDEDSRRRLDKNPLRILDSKEAKVRLLVKQAPSIKDYWDDETRAHLTQTCALLDALEIKYVLDPLLVRGLDYYDKLVFEWISTELGAQNTVCAGGRYDRLSEQLGGKPAPASGFALGMERLMLLLPEEAPVAGLQQSHLFLIGLCATTDLLKIRRRLYHALPFLRVECHFSARGLKSQLKKAAKRGSPLVLIVGEEEIAQEKFSLRNMTQGKQEQLSWGELCDRLKNLGGEDDYVRP